jgi:hypothetical protein
MVALRDGRKLIGVLRSWDQFGGFWGNESLHGEHPFSDLNQPISSSNLPSNVSLRPPPSQQVAIDQRVCTPI